MSDDLADTRMAAYRAARAWATQHNHPQPDDRMINAALTPLLVRMDRDYYDLDDELRLARAGQKAAEASFERVTAERDRLATYVEEHRQRVLNGHTTPGEPDTISQVFIDVDTADPETLRKEVRRLDHRLRWMHDHYDGGMTTSMITAYELAKQRDEARAERDRLVASVVRRYQPLIEAAKAWYAARWNTRAGDSANALSDTIEALEEGPLIPYPTGPFRPEDMNYLIDQVASVELNRLRAALRLCEHVLHRAEPCDAMLHAAQQAAGAYTTDWTLADVADDLAPGTVLDVDDPEIDWNEVRWND